MVAGAGIHTEGLLHIRTTPLQRSVPPTGYSDDIVATVVRLEPVIRGRLVVWVGLFKHERNKTAPESVRRGSIEYGEWCSSSLEGGLRCRRLY